MTECDGSATSRAEATVLHEEELEEMHTRSFAWALSCCQWDREEAADVLQASYLKVLEGRARFGSRSRFSTWLFGVIRHTALERRRKRATRKVLLLRHARELMPASDPRMEGPRSIPFEAAQLRNALTKLPRRQREVLHLVFYEDLSIREASEVMQVGLGSARVHYDRAKRRLRSELSKDTEGEGEEEA